ncbi:hypothetical protein DFH11DRAFT_1830279 [Phellopilus nigrolimitatus]|nr:hypothetical protein DFH11DRAFT_1830279 [Phellopilus nigrolimitatus]
MYYHVVWESYAAEPLSNKKKLDEQGGKHFHLATSSGRRAYNFATLLACSNFRGSIELWLQIFYWATFNPARDLNTLTSIPVFDSITQDQTERKYVNILRVKLNLALVCRWWRDNTREFLYEDVRLRHGAETLADLFEQSRKNCPLALGHGKYVRKIALPFVRYRPAGPVHGWARKEVPRIIKCCPNLLVLSRYHRGQDEFFEPDQESSAPCTNEKLDSDIRHALAAVRCVEWNSGLMLNQHSPVAGPHMEWFAQTLEVLSLNEENYLWPPDVLQRTSVVRLPRVHTLRVGTLCTLGNVGRVHRYTLELPALRRLVLDSGETLTSLVNCGLRVWGLQVRALEIGLDRFMGLNTLLHLLKYCPNAETLHYSGFLVPPGRGDHEFRNLRLVGLHVSRSDEMGPIFGYHLIEAHFKYLLGEESMFPSIRKVELHGMEWATLVSNARFQYVLRLADVRGVDISCKNREADLALDGAKLKYGSRRLPDYFSRR